MASWDMLRELDNLRREIDEAFRSGGTGRPLGGEKNHDDKWRT